MRTRHPAVALAPLGIAGALLLLGACGDDDDAAVEGSTTTSSTRPAETGTTTAEPIPEEPGLVDEGIGDLDELAQSLLIQEGELGDPPLVDAGYTPGAVSAVCGSAVDTDFPADVLVGVVLEDQASDAPVATVVEELRVYADGTAATAAYDAIVAACSGVGTAVGDVGADVPADRATRFDPRGPAGVGTYVVAQTADTVLAFHVQHDAFEPVEVAAFGAGKVAAALEN